MHVLTTATDRDLAARELAELARTTLDEHWAVAAIPRNAGLCCSNGPTRPRCFPATAWASPSPTGSPCSAPPTNWPR